MTIHPIFVHFPIAFLTGYVVLEFITFFSARFKDNEGFQKAKLLLLYAGEVMAIITIFAGGHDSDLSGGPANYVPETVVNIHATFAALTFVWFGLIAISYLVQRWKKFPKLATIGTKITRSWIIVGAAFVGLVLVFTTGALGGAIAYPTTDPVGQAVLHFLSK